MVMSQDQNAEQNHNIKIDNESFERVEQFRYLGTTHLNQNFNQEETECRLKWNWGGMDWIDLAEDRDRWQTLGNTVMNLQAP
jgi:hypothetical protein